MTLGVIATRRRKAWADLRAIFDSSYYLRQNPDVAKACIDPLKHYLGVGWAEGRNPCALFDSDFYLERNPDVALAGLNPLAHYCQYGVREERAVSLLFDAHWYLARNPDVAQADVNPLRHYLNHGAAEGREANPLFDQAWYLERYPQAARFGPCPLAHFAERGARERLSPHPMFDAAFYLERNPDVAKAGLNPLAHFLSHGAAEGRDPGPGFDLVWYRRTYPDIAEAGVNPLLHYVLHGAREGRQPRSADPAASVSISAPATRNASILALEEFDPAYYLAHNPDVARAGVDPFEHYLRHGKREGRLATTYETKLRRLPYAPLVSVIVPNYNHARFLEQRLESIYGQTYQNFDVILLDDASTDGSVEILETFRARHPERTRLIRNESNTGRVFVQWRKGFETARGELLWVCESDDFADRRFLESLVGAFADPSVMIAFGRVQFADADGRHLSGLDGYREAAEPGVWNEPIVRCAHEWFTNGFAVSNLIPNVGGCLIRRQPISEEAWRGAIGYKVLGDWFLYLELSRGGRIAYRPDAVAYFRQHGANTSVTAFRSANYYAEHHRIGELLRKRWEAPEMVLRRLSANLESQYARVDAGRCIAPLDQLFSVRRIAELRRTQPHILMAMLGFELGGGEIFPINLANALVQQGRLVSMMILNSEREDPKIRSRLDRRVAVYDAHLVREMGQGRFLRAAGVDLIHSHNVSLEYFFFVNSSERLSTPYLVTLHGSYECAQIEPRALATITQGVDQWVYLSEKNLGHLEGERSTAHHIANGAPRDERPFHTRRADMGIDAGDFVFAIASRPLRSKGWEEAILALQAAQRRTDRRLRLLLCGDGPEAAPLRQKYQSDSVRFLGYEEQVVGLFRLADCVLLPTRFAGESFPLCLIEAFQAGAPVIATAIGEIPHMLRSGASYAGELLTPTEDDAAFVSALAEAMVRFANDKSPLAAYARTAKALAKTYDIENTVAQYAQLYEEMISKRASVAAAAR